MRTFLRFLFSAGFILAFLSAPAAADEAAELRRILSETLKETRVTQVTKTPYGFYEVVLNNSQIIYTDPKGQVAVIGNLIDLKTRANLSERRLDELRKVDFSKLPLDKAMVKVKGDGSRKIAIFSDPDCPFCKRLEPELEKLDNVTIYTFLYPLTSLHPDAMRKATMVWCSPDRQRAWDDLMLRGKLPEGSLSCATPILEINELARSLGINGTPGIVFESGKLIPGAISSDQIEAQFKSAAS